MDVEQARARLAAIRAAGSKVSTDELDQLWAASETVRPEDILGSWKGSAFVTGHRVEGMLEQANWHGKRFRSASDVQPLICRDAEGELCSPTPSRARAKPACGWSSSAVSRPPPWSTTGSPSSTTSHRSMPTRSWAS